MHHNVSPSCLFSCFTFAAVLPRLPDKCPLKTSRLRVHFKQARVSMLLDRVCIYLGAFETIRCLLEHICAFLFQFLLRSNHFLDNFVQPVSFNDELTATAVTAPANTAAAEPGVDSSDVAAAAHILHPIVYFLLMPDHRPSSIKRSLLHHIFLHFLPSV